METENVLLELTRTVSQRHPVQVCAWASGNKTVINWPSVYRLFCTWSAQLHDFILWVIMSTKYINIFQITNHYTADSILMYAHGCNLKFYNVHVFYMF
jgi:hypothetical protein